MRSIRVLPALLTLSLAAAPLAAQDAECSINTYQPAALGQATLTIQRAAGATTAGDATKALRDAMKFLNDERKIAANPLGAGFLKGQIYILWLHQDGTAEQMTNEKLNAGGSKTASVDLAGAADSLFKLVEAQGPGCVEATSPWRQSKPWTERINKAYHFLGADQVDSAEYYATRSALLYSNSAFVHNAMAQVADKRGNKAGLLSHLKTAIELAKPDSTIDETRRQMMFQYAANAQQYALGGEAPNKDALLKESVDMFLEILQDDPKAKEAAYAFSAASEVVAQTQDTARGREILGMMSAEAQKYDDLTLLLAADMARMLQRNDDAMTMYAAALEKNPNVRDANYFLAFMYYEKKDASKMLPLTEKVIALDPSNPDNYMMHGEALKLTALAEKDAAKKAALIKQAEATTAMEGSMQHRVLITQFERRAEGALLKGTVENRGRAPKAYTLTVEFMDLAGEVVETMTAEVSTVKPSETGKFEITATKPGIAAFRYAPLK